ncbi:MAG: leucine-rich repeat domain-containing protein [Clostridiales bacterium]
MLKKVFLFSILLLIFISVNVFGETSDTENIINGDFTDGTTNWSEGFYSPGEGSISESNGELLISITEGGTETWNIQINQGSINLYNETEYTFSFDARSVSARTIEANVGMSEEPYTSYFASGPLNLSTDMKTYSFTFTTTADDSTARVEFNCGLDVNDVYIDNVSLIGGSAPTTITPLTPEIINFPDQNLEAAVRAEINIVDEPIYNTDVYTLTSLNLSKQDIADITGLEHFTGLTKLMLGNNSVNNITPLENLTNLRELNIGANHLSDITPLKNLTNLTSLNLVVNDITDITSLENLTNLTSLLLEYNDFTDITSLNKLTNVTYLKLNDNEISNIRPLENLTNVTYLDLSNNEIADVIPLENCTKLTYLNLCGNPISDITALGELIDLKTLVLNTRILENVEPLANCTNLISLNLNLNSISDITSLENLNNLKTLFLVGNPLNEQAQVVIDKLLSKGTRVLWSPIETSSTETPTDTASVEPSITPSSTTTVSSPTLSPEVSNEAVQYTIDNDWDGAATISVAIKNIGDSEINGWTLSWTFPEDQQITNMWGGSYTQSGQSVIVKNDIWNETIPVNGTVNFGFNLSYIGSNSVPDSFTLN